MNQIHVNLLQCVYVVMIFIARGRGGVARGGAEKGAGGGGRSRIFLGNPTEIPKGVENIFVLLV